LHYGGLVARLVRRSGSLNRPSQIQPLVGDAMVDEAILVDVIVSTSPKSLSFSVYFLFVFRLLATMQRLALACRWQNSGLSVDVALHLLIRRHI
jgi:hypothetical protein